MPYYVVWLGKKNGIYENWSDCQREINGFKGAIYKKFETPNEAKIALSNHPNKYVKMNTSMFTDKVLNKNKVLANKYVEKSQTKNQVKTQNKTTKKSKTKKNTPTISDKQRKEMIGLNIENAICIDGSCVIDANISYAFGKIEYQGVFLKNKELIFRSRTYPKGTNNIAEFLAIVEALRYVKENNLKNAIIYTDSVTAINWISNKTYNTKLERDSLTESLFRELEYAKEFLLNNEINCPILKWQTKSWGENPADFGRK